MAVKLNVPEAGYQDPYAGIEQSVGFKVTSHGAVQMMVTAGLPSHVSMSPPTHKPGVVTLQVGGSTTIKMSDVEADLLAEQLHAQARRARSLANQTNAKSQAEYDAKQAASGAGSPDDNDY